MYETLRIDREGHLTWLTLHRPEALNAMDPTLVRELRQFLWELPEDRETRVLVMRGAGREDRNQVLAAATADFREGVAAFLEKRPARFEDA